ncbi:MAG: hypothetical protein E6J69_10095 [Deltaproteobacteria bacterium]|nr:MAG: hypothetical protein E6J69_10095 [Deltaproteobacteria bacterium]
MAKATLVVDETGAVVLGAQPARVEVTNFPTGGAAVVTVYGSTVCPAGFAALYVGGVYYARGNISGVLPTFDGACWQSQPDYGGYGPGRSGDCVVCRG